MKKILIAIIVLAGLAAAGMYAAPMLGRPQFEQQTKEVFDQLSMLASSGQPAYRPEDLAGFPPVMKAYLEKAMPPMGKKARLVTVWQNGEIKLSQEASWDRYEAKQLITRRPSQMAWAAEVQYGPLMPVLTRSVLTKESGSVSSYLWGLLDTYDNSGGAIKQYLMLRWLAEAVWHPDALLPGEGLIWQEAESPTASTEAARVTLNDGVDSVSGLFIFTSRGGPPMMFLADEIPYGQFAGQRWYCQYSDWRRQGSLQLPFSMTQGVRQGIGDDVRLRLKVKKIELQ